MVCKVLFYDYGESDKLFFEKNKLENFDIKLFSHSLNKKSVKDLTPEEFEYTTALNVSSSSVLCDEVIKHFKNLRIIATRSEEVKHIDIKTCLDKNIAVVNVDKFTENNHYASAHTSFKTITGVLCGYKEFRVV